MLRIFWRTSSASTGFLDTLTCTVDRFRNRFFVAKLISRQNIYLQNGKGAICIAPPEPTSLPIRSATLSYFLFSHS
jgi:hypothetical protein